MGAGGGPIFGLTWAIFLVVTMGVTEYVNTPEVSPWGAGALAYLGLSGLALFYLREAPTTGWILTLYLFMTVWAADTGAYVVGRMIGGAKLWPSVSPQKTWAGLYGALGTAAVVGGVIGALSHGAIHPVIGTLVGVGVGLVSQGGDLFESFLKRRAGVKDSGTLIPGHGGILDRIDGLIAAAIFLAIVKAAAPTGVL